MSCAPAEGTTIGGESSSLTPAAGASELNAAFGAVSFVVVLVIQSASLPEVKVAQPPGNAGAKTESKFSDETVPSTPSDMLKVANPRSFVPSCRCRTGLMIPPQVPEAVKENGCVTAEPPASSEP